MIMRIRQEILIGIFLLILSSGVCVGAQASESDSDNSKVSILSSDSDYILKAGDRINLRIFPEDDFIKSSEIEISPEGKVTIPVVGKVELAGKTIIEGQETIVNILAESYFVDPEAVIEVLEYQDLKVVILGEVSKPGNYSFPAGTNKLTLLQAVSLAGGFSDIANIKKVKIMRKNEDGKTKKIKANINDIIEGNKPDVELRPDDIIHVPESFF